MSVSTPLQPSPIQTTMHANSPPASPSSLATKRSRSPLSLDLSSVPGLISPAPPSNTLLITRLDNPLIFHPASLATIREHIATIAPLNSFSPLKSMQRIICSFYSEDAAIKVRQEIDGTAILGSSVAKCYFGEPTPVDHGKKYLDKPDAGRLFFISPPPSPPVGWEMKEEDPPNKEVHADDLASKLSRLAGKMETPEQSPTEAVDPNKVQYTADDLHKMQKVRNSAMAGLQDEGESPKRMRSRSSTLIYDPKAHGDSPALPAVMLETEDDSDVELETRPINAHTARPPIELMEVDQK